MANYLFQMGTTYLDGITTGEATYTFTVEYFPPFNWTYVNLTLVSTCGAHMYVRLPYDVGALGDGTIDPVVMAQIQVNVDNYMASLEV